MPGYGNEDIIPGFDEEEGDLLDLRLEVLGGERKALALHLAGRLDGYNADYFERSVARAVGAGFLRLVLVCEELSHISAAGLAALVRSAQGLRDLGGGLAFAAMSPRVYETFDILGLAQVYPFCDRVDLALARIVAPVPSKPRPHGVTCPGCGRRLLADRAGKYLCGSCRTKMIVDGRGMARAC